MNNPDIPAGGDRARKEAALFGLGLASAGSGGALGWEAPTAEALAGVFPGLRVVELCGRGGMGAVYRAEQTRLGRMVAVKILPTVAMPDPLARERFEREARVLSGLSHPHVLHVHDFGALADGTLYLVTEWAEGGDLARLFGGRAQPLATVCAWVEQIAAALDAAHARGVVHRDLKPANVLVRADGRLALADFGLAHAQGAGFTTGLTLSGTVFGTYDYMAPEQLGGAGGVKDEAVTPAVDVYALGVVTYQLVTGILPRGAYARPSNAVGAPVALDSLLDAAMSTDRAKRPKSAGEFARRLAAACEPRGRIMPKRWIKAGAGLCTLAAVLAMLAWKGVIGGAKVTPGGSVVVTVAGTEPVAQREAVGRGVEPATEPEAMVPSVEAPPKTIAKEAPVAPWTWVLPMVRTGEHRVSGAWDARGGELISGDGVCVLRLPVNVAADYSYDVAVEFTRIAGANSVAVFLPTAAGVGVFELDAWEQGLGGMQMIDGQDLRAQGRSFPAALRNGERQQVVLNVRGTRVSAVWNGVPRMTWDLTGCRLEPLGLWGAGANMRLGLGSWSSPTAFHRVAYRVIPPGS